METDLRLILVIIGVCVVLGIVWDAYRRSRPRPHSSKDFDDMIFTAPNEDAPQFEVDGDPLFDDFEPVLEKKEVEDTPQASFSTSIPQEVIALTIIARSRQGFTGRSVESALQACHFKYGPKHIYHRHQDDDSNKQIHYSVASIVEPGTLEHNMVKVSSFPGLMMFMIVPDDFEAQEVFTEMLATAKNMANMLNGELCDSQRCNLTLQMVEHYREKISDIQRRELANRQANEKY